MDERLSKKIKELENEANTLKELLVLYPDLSYYQSRWSAFLQSSLVNNFTENIDVEFRRSCGCCSDAIIYAMPYRSHGETKVYSNPAQISIGEGLTFEDGIEEYKGWEIKTNLSEIIIDKIRKYLDNNRPKPYDDEDEEQ